MMELDPVKVKNAEIAREISAILNDETLSSEFRDALKKLNTCFLKKKPRPLKPGTRGDYLAIARRLLQLLGRLPEEWTPEDLTTVITHYADSASGYRNSIRSVLRWFLRCYKNTSLLILTRVKIDEASTPQELTTAQTMTCEESDTISLDETITPEWVELTEMHIRGITSIADLHLGALIWTSWDVGGRPDDMRTLKMRDVAQSGTTIVLTVEPDTKTGTRPMVLNHALGEFNRYLAGHPYRHRTLDNKWVYPNVALFLDHKGKPWNKGRLNRRWRRLRKLVVQAQKDPSWPFPPVPEDLKFKDLRPNAVSRDREMGMTAEENALVRGQSEKVMKKHYDKADKKKRAVRAVMRMRGVEWEPEEDKRDPWRPCPKCNIPNSPGSEYCTNCGDPVSPEAIRIEYKKKQEHEERLRVIEEKLGIHEAEDFLDEAIEVKKGQKP